MQVSELSNLGVLSLGKGLKAPDIGIDDSVIRAWMRAATESNAFSMLRALNCQSQRRITGESFGYLARFPRLAMVQLSDCGISPQDIQDALHWGWEHKTGKDLNAFWKDIGLAGYECYSFYFVCYRWGRKYSIKQSKSPTLEVDYPHLYPVLNYFLGPAVNFAKNPRGAQASILFHRSEPSTLVDEAAVSSKRPGDDDSYSSGPSRKKPTMRASKQQDMGNVLMGFGS